MTMNELDVAKRKSSCGNDYIIDGGKGELQVEALATLVGQYSCAQVVTCKSSDSLGPISLL
jgi:hypothetical protein